MNEQSTSISNSASDYTELSAQWQEKYGNMLSIFLQVSDMFLSHAEQSLQKIDALFASDQWSETYNPVHRLAGSVANFADAQTVDLGYRLMDDLRHPVSDQVAQLRAYTQWQVYRLHVERIIEALEKFRQTVH